MPLLCEYRRRLRVSEARSSCLAHSLPLPCLTLRTSSLHCFHFTEEESETRSWGAGLAPGAGSAGEPDASPSPGLQNPASPHQSSWAIGKACTAHVWKGGYFGSVWVWLQSSFSPFIRNGIVLPRFWLFRRSTEASPGLRFERLLLSGARLLSLSVVLGFRS